MDHSQNLNDEIHLSRKKMSLQMQLEQSLNSSLENIKNAFNSSIEVSRDTAKESLYDKMSTMSSVEVKPSCSSDTHIKSNDNSLTSHTSHPTDTIYYIKGNDSLSSYHSSQELSPSLGGTSDLSSLFSEVSSPALSDIASDGKPQDMIPSKNVQGNASDEVAEVQNDSDEMSDDFDRLVF